MEDPWTGKVEKLRVSKEEVDARRRRENTRKPSYWGERETKEWRRKLREEKEKVERERRERLEWRIWEMQKTEQQEDPGRRSIPPKSLPGWATETRTQFPCRRGRRDRY